MPYTPPSHRSPSSSAASSPDTSRRSSFNVSKAAPPAYIASPASPALPRSSSYLARHRRTSSAVSSSSTTSSTSQSTPRSTSDDLKGMVSAVNNGIHVNDDQSSIRQSPPPITGDNRVMPAGAIISPPDSPPSSDDEERVARGRRIENMSELKELHEAISQLPKQRRASSPSEPADREALAVQPLQPLQTTNLDAMCHGFNTSSLDHFTRVAGMVARSSSQSNSSNVSSRKVSHVRSATEPSISITPSGSSSQLNSDEENDLEILKKPQMVRKKSGELVRPALRLGAGRRPSSMPGTPTFSKVVHFDSHLEHVRHFLQVDRPLAVSAGSSPVETYDSETEYPFTTNGNSNKQTHRAPPYEWEIMLTKFPVDTPARRAQPVRLERVWLSPDHKFLHGSIAVLNLAFAKSVVCRFTLDYWKTTSEIAAEYSAEIIPRVATEGHDRFNFTIKLSDLANLESKTMYFCVRYSVAGKEFWDNNDGSNFQLDFKKKTLPMNGKNSLQSSALPRSHHRRANPSSVPRPRSMPVSMDAFEDGTKVMFDRSVEDYLGEAEHPTLRLKSSQSALTLPSDNLAGRLSSPSGQAFANRYDFGASLSAAKQATKDTAPTPVKRDGGLYMKPSRRGSPVPTTADNTTPVQLTTAISTAKEPTKTTVPAAGQDRTSRAAAADLGVYGPGSIASKSYDEIVSKYCFYVPKPMAVIKDVSSQQGHSKSSSVGEIVTQPNQPSPASSTASDGSPVQIGSFYLHGQRQQPPDSARWFDVPSRDSSSSSIQSFGSDSSATVMASSTTKLAPSQSGIGSSATNSPTSPSSPATIVGSFAPFSDSTSGEFSFLKDRFPFIAAEGHSTPAIKG